MWLLFAKGLALGLALAAPVGPIGLLCIRRTLAEGPAMGFATGMGAATADAAYGAIAGFGLAIVADAIVAQKGWLAVIGGLFLIWLGIRTAIARPGDPAAPSPHAGARGLIGAWATTTLLTLANPATILTFAAAFAGLGLAEWAGGTDAALVLILGVFIGSAAWWLALSAGVGLLRARVGPRALAWVNRASGVALAAFGAGALLTAFA